MSDLAEYFKAGDVISITNADRPEWADGKWRVTTVHAFCVLLQPLNDDLTVDAARDQRHEYVIENGGIRAMERR